MYRRSWNAQSEAYKWYLHNKDQEEKANQRIGGIVDLKNSDFRNAELDGQESS